MRKEVEIKLKPNFNIVLDHEVTMSYPSSCSNFQLYQRPNPSLEYLLARRSREINPIQASKYHKDLEGILINIPLVLE